MSKFMVRLSVAFVAFSLSLLLTDISWRWRGYYSCVGPVATEQAPVPVPVLDFASDRAQINQIYSQYATAQMRHDRAFFERVETDDFILFTGGAIYTREQNIQWMEAQPRDIRYEQNVEYLQVFGDTAVGHGRIFVGYPGGEGDSFSFTDVWIKTDGAWRIQSTTSTD